MKLRNNYFYTIREDIKDEDSVSGNLLVRSGMIKKSSAGVYMFLPLGLRVLDKIRYIVKDEMDKADLKNDPNIVKMAAIVVIITKLTIPVL